MSNVADGLQYRHLRNTALPFITATAPTSSQPNFVDGSNIKTSYKGYLERRDGFDVGWETIPTTFTGTIKRTFCWRRWGGAFFIMLNEVTATASNVYKLALGVDVSFVSIFSSSSVVPFDFVVSNNFCFFGNGTDMKKFDGTTITKWGIAAPNISTTAATSPASGTSSGAPAWANPGRITAPDASDATSTIVGPTGSKPFIQTFNLSTGLLIAQTFGFAIPTTATILGITVEMKGSATWPAPIPPVFSPLINGGSVVMSAQLMKAGAAVGGTESTLLPNNVADAYFSLGGVSDLWGSTWTPADINGANFGVNFAGLVSYHLANGQTGASVTFNADHVRFTITYSDNGSGAPTVSTSGTGITAVTGYQYVYSYFNSTTGHVSSPSAASASTGAFANKTVNVGVTASTDPQVDKIRIFRTTDGGGGVFFEIQNSPVANATTTYPDVTTDANLSIITAPTFGFNDPPPNQRGFVWFANRIWGFNNASVFFTDWEEMNIGVPEEASVSGGAGNFWNFDSEVTGLSVAQDGVIVFTGGSIYKIDGDSLDTFRRTTIAHGVGCRNNACIARLGGLTAFLANTNSIWTTDSYSLQEISQWIQPTIDGIDHSKASMTFHIQGQQRWLLLCDPSHSQTLPFDVNQQQFMPPWSIVPTAVHSGETTPGMWDLLATTTAGTKMLQLTPGVYLDDGLPYAANFTTNLIPIVNEHLSTDNATIDLYYPQAPEHVAYLEFVGMDTNQFLPSSVKFILDDTVSASGFAQLASDNFNRADENPLVNPPWIPTPPLLPLQLLSNAVSPNNTQSVDEMVSLYDGGIAWSDDQYSEAAITAGAHLSGNLAVFVRGNSIVGGVSGYLGWVDFSQFANSFVGPGSACRIALEDTAGLNRVDGTVSPVLAGDVMRIQAVGSRISLLYNGVEQLFIIDNTTASGKPGLGIFRLGAVAPSSIAWDNWAGGGAKTYTDITANSKDAPLKGQGGNVVDKWYYARQITGKRCSVKVGWPADTANFKIYTFTLAYKVYR